VPIKPYKFCYRNSASGNSAASADTEAGSRTR
jgi:hypothetical protein